MPSDYSDLFVSPTPQLDQWGGSTKYEAVQEASRIKIAQLEQRRNFQLALKKAQEDSIVGKLGLDPNTGLGTAANTVLATAGDALDIATNVVATPLGLAGKHAAADAFRKALRHAGDIAPRDDTEQEQSGLIRRLVGDPAVALASGVVGLGDAVIGVGDIATLGLAGKGWDALGRDSKATHKAIGNLYSPEQKLANQNVDDATGFLSTVESMLNNPATIVKGVIESLPTMLAGGGIGKELLTRYPATAAYVAKTMPALAGLTEGGAGAIGEGITMAGSAAEDIRNDNADGRLNLKQALLSAGIGVMGAAVSRLGGKTAERLGVGDIDQALVAGKLSKSPHGYALSTGLAGAVEGGEEAIQSAGETILKNIAQDKEWDMGVGKAAAQGLMTAFPMGAYSGLGGRAAHGAKEHGESQTRNAAQEAAITTGDVTALLDPKSPVYSPSRAIAALAGHSAQETTTPEQKQANLEEATKVVATLQAERDKAQEGVDKLSPEGLAKLDAQIATLRAAGKEDAAKAFEEVATSMKDTAKGLPAMQKGLAAVEEHLSQANEALASFNTDLNANAGTGTTTGTGEVDVAAHVATINAPVEATNTVGLESRQKAADTLINLSMAVPDRLDPQVAESLAANTSNGLSANQRTYLRAFSAARVAENQLKDMKKVSQEIYTGSPKNVGIAQYRERMAAAVAAGNQVMADRQLADLKNFEAGHKAKAALILKARAESNANGGNEVQVIRAAEKRWFINRGAPKTQKERKEGGFFYVYRGTPNEQIAAVGIEAVAITKAHDELKAAYAVKFSRTTQGSETNVTHVSEASDATQNSAATNQKAQVASSDGASNDAGSVSPVGSTSVESAGVEATGVTTQPTKVSALRKSSEKTSSKAHNTAVEQLVTGEESKSEAESQTGTLEVLSRKTAEGTTYNLRNLIADYFTQVGAKTGSKSQRPLVAVKDFLSTAFNRERVKEFLGLDKDAELSDQQLGALKGFRNLATAWLPKIQANLKFKGDVRHEYWYEDMMQFFIQEVDGKPDIEENIKTAIAYAAFGYVAENATRTAGNSNEEINAILLRNENHPVNEDEQAMIGPIGTRQNVVINSLGAKALQALGFKVAKNAPQDLLPRLTSALGAHAMKLLLDLEVMERSYMTAQELADLTGNEVNAKYKEVVYPFLKLARDEQYKLHPTAEEIYAANRGSGNMLDKLFGIEDGMKDPGSTPVPFIQKTIRNTLQLVPKALAKMMAHENSQPNYLRMDMWLVVAQLGTERMLKIAGQQEVDPTKVHKINRAPIEAKNDGLRRELETFQDYVEHVWSAAADGLESAIYLPHTVWKQHRVGIGSTVVNPQTSKIHRHLLTRPTWKTTIDPSNTDQMENFKLRVAEGLGIKVDNKNKEAALTELSEKLQDPKILAGVAVLRKIAEKQDITEGDKDTIVEAVALGKENMHAFDALVALAAESRDKPFDVTLIGEVDGVTNGPMLSHFLLGAARSSKELISLLNRGGFFQLGSKYSNYNKYRGDAAAGNFDLYETTTGHMVKVVQGFIVQGIVETKGKLKGKMIMSAATVKKTATALYAFTGELVDKTDTVQKAGRDIVKTPLTAMVFGSAVQKAVDSMADKFVESIYAAIEKTAAGGTKAMSREDLVEHVNTLLRMSNGKALSTNITIDQLMEGDFDKGQTKALKETFKLVIGRAVEATMENDFSTFMAQRKALNETAKLAFTLHNALYQAMRQKMIQEMIAKDQAEPGTGIASRTILKGEKKGQVVALHDLTVAQEQDIRDRLAKVAPVVHTYFSKQDGNLDAGLAVSKGGRKLSQDDTYSQEVSFGTKTPDGKGSVNTHGYEQQETDPGVAMVPMSVHSLDSAISHMAAMLGEVLNVHDAHAAGVGTFHQTARNLNQSTWKALLNYSPATEMADTLTRTIQGMADLIRKDALPAEALTAVKGALEGMNNGEGVDLGAALRSIRATAFSADFIKLNTMSMLQSIDQYALEGGQYEVTDPDRAEAKAMMEKLRESVGEENPQDIAAIEVIETALEAVTGKEQAGKQEKQTNDLGITEVQDVPAETASPFGSVGAPAIQSDSVLVEFFKENPLATAKEVIQKLYSMLKDKTGRTNEFNTLLLKKLVQVVNPELLFRLVTPSTDVSDLLAPPKEAVRAWFVAKGFDEEINVLSPEFANSGLTVETLIHELTHGALARIVAREQADEKANPKYRSDALELIGELEELREKAQTYAKKQGFTQFDAALGDIQEFIAWGMTNQEFQRVVLNQVSMVSKTGTNELVNGLKTFINKLVELLFKGSTKTQQEIAVNGLTILISNVSGLMNEADQSNSTTELNLSMASPMGRVQGYTTLDIHNALNQGNVTTAFNTHLQELLSGIVQKLHGPFGAFKESFMKDRTITAMDVWAKALNTGIAPFASKLKAAPILISEREMHAMEQVEAVMRAVLARNEVSAKTAYKELTRLFMEMRAAIKPSDFASQTDYDFIFKIGLDAQGRSDHLARFAAFGLAHQEFNKLMQQATAKNTTKVSSGKGFADRFQIMFEKVLAFFHETVTRTYAGEQADKKLTKLVEQLVDIEARKLAAIAAPGVRLMDTVEGVVADAAEVVKDTVIKAANSPFVKNHSNTYVRAAGAIANTIAKSQADWVMKGIVEIRDRNFKGKHGFAMQMLTEVRGPGKVLNALSLASNSQQRHRKQVIDHTAKFSLQSFDKMGKGLTKATKAAIAQVFMRTGMHALMDQYNMAELEQLVGNQHALATAVHATEQQLNGFPQFREHFINQANALAAYRVTGRVHTKMLMMNAHNIARMYGFKQRGRLTEAEAKLAEPVIEKLVALYAIGYAGKTSLYEAKNIFHSENQRSDGGNGVEYVLRMHKLLEEQSHAKLFQGQRALMMHGHTPEIYNHNTGVTAATEDESKALKLLGYVEGELVTKDPHDPDRDVKRLYVLRDGAPAPYLSGIMSTTTTHSKGSPKHNGFLNVNTPDGLMNAAMQTDIANAKGSALLSGPRRNLAQEGLQTYMAPVVNPTGEIVNWRYLMQDKTKDALLERTNDFEKIMGVLAGSIYDKESTPEINSKALTALRDIDRAERHRHPESFIQVGPRSTDSQLRDTWNMLPRETREEAKRIWGGKEGLWVRKDALTTVFGYRKFSLADAFSKEPDARNKIESIFVAGMEHVLENGYRAAHPLEPRKNAEDFAKRAAVYVTKGERGWQELVRETKDIMVVKSGVVMLGNIWSNLWLLKLSGVSLSDILKGHLVAMRGVRAYQTDSEELARLQALVDTGLTGTKAAEIQQEMVRLTDALERNPVKELIDAGLMPTISEDIGDEDPYSYKSAVVRATEHVTNKINPTVLNAAKTVLITHDTKLYQGLSRITQISDFVARYTLYQHLTTKKENSLSKEDAVFEASESFVNYDLPMPKGMQYLDDMGITMFTKYFLRIQRVLSRMTRDNPAQVLMTIALNNFLDLGPIVLDSSWLHKVGNNPLNWGALQLPGSVSELGTVAGAMALVK